MIRPRYGTTFAPRRTSGPLMAARVALGVLSMGAFVIAIGPSAGAAGPDKTAWYDTTGAQEISGVTTPSLATNGKLQVSYIPVSIKLPSEDVPTTPVTLPALPVSPPSGDIGGNQLGTTLAFAAVQYTVNLNPPAGAIDPTSIRATLTLSLATDSVAVSSGDLVACPTENTLWAAGDDQDSAAAPSYDCGGGQGVTGNITGEGVDKSVSFSLGAAQEDEFQPNVFSLVIVPGSSPNAPFSAIINAPTSSNFVVNNESPATDLNDNFADSDSFGDTGSTFSPLPAYTISPYEPTSSGLTTPTLSPTTSAPGTTPTTTEIPGPVQGQLVGLAAPAVSGSTQRTVAVVMLLALLAGLFMTGSGRRREPRSLRVQRAKSDP